MPFISTFVTIDMETLKVVDRRGYEYEGFVDRLCGGDANAGEKQQLAQSQVDLNNQLDSIFKQDQSLTAPFWQQQLQNGLPYFNSQVDFSNGTLAQQAAPLRAQMERNLAGFGDTLPDGFRQQNETDFNSQLAEQFDQNVLQAQQAQYAAKQQAAAQLNPLQVAQVGNSTASSVLSSPAVQSGGVGNFLGGLASGLLNNAKVGTATGAGGASLPGLAWSL